MKNRKLLQSVSFLLALLLVCVTCTQAAELPSYEAARHEAFARGGAAIGDALNYKEDSKVNVARAVEENVPPVPPAPSTPQANKESNRMAPWKYGALAAGFTVMGILLYHWATGPGASIRNCSTCQK